MGHRIANFWRSCPHLPECDSDRA